MPKVAATTLTRNGASAQPARSRQQDQRNDDGRHQHKWDCIRVGEVLQRYDNGRRHIALRRAQPRYIADTWISTANRKADQQTTGDEEQQRQEAAGSDQADYVGGIQPQPDHQQDHDSQAADLVHYRLPVLGRVGRDST